MKKIALLIAMLVSTMTLTFAQDIYLDIEDRPNDTSLCCWNNQRVFIYAQVCDNYGWMIDGHVIENTSPIVINPTSYNHDYHIMYGGCNGFLHEFHIKYKDALVPNSFTKTVWGLPGESIRLHAMGADSLGNYNIQWQGGPSGNNYDVVAPDTYPVTISSPCGTTTRTYIRYDKVEIYRATIDLETNLNKVTWPIIPGQDEYISEVKAYRDGLLVGTVPYEQGYFLDNIGSDNAARNYHLVAVTTDGVESPISYQKGTIHTTYYEDVNGNLNMTWNIPYVEEGAQGTLTYFQICKYDSNTGGLTVVDQVNSSITDYTCGVNQFDGGYPVIAAVFNDAKDRDYEDRSFSNMYTDISNQPHEITITLMPGWNWISYPYAVVMNIATALGDFVPMLGDIINSQNGGTTTFVNGRWRGQFTSFTPGLGYMYYSARNEPVTLVFGESRKIMVK